MYSRALLRIPARVRWNIEAVETIQAPLRVSNFETARQAKVMPAWLTKKFDIGRAVPRSKSK